MNVRIRSLAAIAVCAALIGACSSTGSVTVKGPDGSTVKVPEKPVNSLLVRAANRRHAEAVPHPRLTL